MRKPFLKVVEKSRITSGPLATEHGCDYGAFLISKGAIVLAAIVGVDDRWEHVSVSLPDRTPSWSEMCFIKELFFEDEDTVVQFHPKKSEYVNMHPHCLHMWKPIGFEIQLPDRKAI